MPQNTKRPKPAYQRIKDCILNKIHTGQWQAGQVIPTECELAAQFSVSRMTVNRALRELSQDRVLERRQGSGTFVAQQQYNHTVVEVRNIATDIKAAGKVYAAKVINQQRLKASEVDARVLAMFMQPMLDSDGNHTVWHKEDTALEHLKHHQFPDTEIDEVEIVHIADGEPVQYEARWVDASLVPRFIEQDFTVINTSEYLISKAPLQGGSYTIRAVSSPQKVADALNIAVGEPALLLSRQTYSSGRVVTFVNMWHAGSRYQFSGSL